MSPWSFSIYMDGVMREVKGKVGEVGVNRPFLIAVFILNLTSALVLHNILFNMKISLFVLLLLLSLFVSLSSAFHLRVFFLFFLGLPVFPAE